VSQKTEEGFALAELLFERTDLAGRHIAHKAFGRAVQGAREWLSSLLQRWRRQASPTTHAKQLSALARGWSTVVWVRSNETALRNLLADWRRNREECHFRKSTATLTYQLRHATWYGQTLQQGRIELLLAEAGSLGRAGVVQVRALASLKQELILARNEARRAAEKADERDRLLQLMTESGVEGGALAGRPPQREQSRVTAEGGTPEEEEEERTPHDSVEFEALTRNLQATRLLQRLGVARDAAALNRQSLERRLAAWFNQTQRARLEQGIRVGLDAGQAADVSAKSMAMATFRRHGPGEIEVRDTRRVLQRWASRSREFAMHTIVAALGAAARAHETDWRIKEQKGLLQGRAGGGGPATSALLTELSAECDAEEASLMGLRRQLVSLQRDKEGLEGALRVYEQEVEQATVGSEEILREVLRIEHESATLMQRKVTAVIELQRLEDGSAINEIQAMIDARLPGLRDVEWEWDEVSTRHEDLRNKVAVAGEEAAKLKTAYQGLQEENATVRAALEAEQQIMNSVKCEMELVKLDLETAQTDLAHERGIRDEVGSLYEASKQKLAEVNSEMSRVDRTLEDQQATLRLKLESIAELQSEILAMLPPGLGVQEDLFETAYWKEALGDAVEAQLSSLQGVQAQLAEIEAEQAVLIETAVALEGDFTLRNAAMAEARERKFIQDAEADKLESEAAGSELRLNHARNSLSKLHAEMGLTEAEQVKILYEMTELTEQQQGELGKMRDLTAEIARTEEKTASVSYEAAQAKAKHNETVAEKDKINAVLCQELRELEELHGDLKSTSIVSGSVQRELEQTRIVLASAKVELGQVSVMPASPPRPATPATTEEGPPELPMESPQAPSPAPREGYDPVPNASSAVVRDEAFADPVLAKARRLLDAAPGDLQPLPEAGTSTLQGELDDILQGAASALAAPSPAMAETGATLAEALSPPSPAGLPLGESPLSPGASPAEGSMGKRLSSRKGFLGHARAKYGL